jgi:hypothetical protein
MVIEMKGRDGNMGDEQVLVLVIRCCAAPAEDLCMCRCCSLSHRRHYYQKLRLVLSSPRSRFWCKSNQYEPYTKGFFHILPRPQKK